MQGPPLGPGGEDITWPDQVAPRGRKASSTRKIKPQTSNLFVARSPFDEGCSKVLASHFDFRIPLVAGLATDIPTLIERCVRSASRQLVREWCGSSPTVDVDGLAELGDSGIRLRHDCGMAFVQEYVPSSLTSHGARRNSEYRWFERGVSRNTSCPPTRPDKKVDNVGVERSSSEGMSMLMNGRRSRKRIPLRVTRSTRIPSTNCVRRGTLRARTDIPLRSRGIRAVRVQSGKSSPTGQVDGGTWCVGVVRIGFGLFSESKVLLELDCKVVCSM